MTELNEPRLDRIVPPGISGDYGDSVSNEQAPTQNGIRELGNRSVDLVDLVVKGEATPDQEATLLRRYQNEVAQSWN